MPENKSKKLIRGTVTYAIGDFGTKILSFLIVPLYTYYINTHDMGVYDLLISTSGLLLPIITLQISDAAYKWMISGEREPKQCIQASYDVIFLNCLLSTLVILIINFCRAIPYCYYFIGLIITSSWYSTILKLVRGLKRQRLYAAIGVLFTAINVCLNLLQIVILKKGVVSLFTSTIISYVICCFVALIVERDLRKVPLFTHSSELINKFVKYSAPLIPNYLNWWLINSSDSYIVTIFLGADSNGILSVAHKFPAVLQTVFALFNTAWQDLVISERKKDPEFYSKVFDAISSAILGMLLVLTPLTKLFIQLVMSQDYKVASNYIPLYYLGAVFQGFSSFYGVGYLKNNKTGRAFITSIYAAVINLVVDLLAIKTIGIHAASLSTFIGFFVMWIIRERQNREELGILVNWHSIIVLTILNLIIAFVSNNTSLSSNLIIALVGFALFMMINKKYFDLLKDMIKHRR